jgi:hypothetical protein
MYAYPSLDEPDRLTTAEQMEVAPNLRHLYQHLLQNHLIEEIRRFNRDYLAMYAGDVLAKIQAGDTTWERLVPTQVADVIKAKKLFGCRG